MTRQCGQARDVCGLKRERDIDRDAEISKGKLMQMGASQEGPQGALRIG